MCVILWYKNRVVKMEAQLTEHSDECVQILRDNYAILNEQFQRVFHSIL